MIFASFLLVCTSYYIGSLLGRNPNSLFSRAEKGNFWGIPPRNSPGMHNLDIHLLTGGTTVHHKRQVTMAIKMEDGRLASNSKENMSLFGPHFDRVYNNHRPVDLSVLENVPQCPTLRDIDSPITFEEVNHAINKLKSGKSPGLNGIPPEAWHHATTCPPVCF